MQLEDTLVSWSTGPGQTEQTKADNAVMAIQKAIKAHTKLTSMDIGIFPQGSYRARTNVRQNSDVDVCVCLNSTFFPDYPGGKTHEHYGNVDGEMMFSDFKDLVGEALTDYFGATAVTRGNKAFDIHENSYRIDADVVPAFQHRRYHTDGTNGWIKPEGTAFDTDNDDTRIINWPEQTYTNGITKNNATSRRYKRVIRILKRLRDKMQTENIAAAKDIASFLIESLVWNAPNDHLNHTYYHQDVRDVLAYLFNNTRNVEDCKEWGEVNELKYLFSTAQPWTMTQAHNFISAAWDYLGFE